MVEPTHLKNLLVKLDHFPRVWGENKKSLKPPTSFLKNHPKWLLKGRKNSDFFQSIPLYLGNRCSNAREASCKENKACYCTHCFLNGSNYSSSIFRWHTWLLMLASKLDFNTLYHGYSPYPTQPQPTPPLRETNG